MQTEEQYIDMVLRKSGSLFRLACRLGASGCKVDGETARLLDEMADALGVAAQIGNDVSDVLRFDLKNDLLQRKKTLPVLYMLSDPEDRFPPLRSYYEGEASLALFLSRKQECLNYIRESGRVEYAEAIQSIYRNRALKALSELPGDPYPKQQLRERLLLSLGGSL
ncbi:polyprenyl synthetase family protein [Paenibacillus sp. P25]|nr:polyprenyl synthetase family protein [Paenibacillus sp. P25]